MPSVITAPEQLYKAVAESIVKTFDFTKWLGTNETLADVTSVTQEGNVTGATALTLGTPSINSVEITVDGVTIDANKAVQLTVAAGQNLVHYTLVCTVVTTTPQTFQLNGDLLVTNE